MTSTMPVNMIDNLPHNNILGARRQYDGILRNGSALEAGLHCTANCLNDMRCFLVSLPLLPPQHRNRDIDGSIEDISRPDKAFTFLSTAQWLEILTLQGSCNSCSRLAHFTLSRYSGFGHD